MKWNIHTADVLDALGEIEDDTFDACFCDPPYGLSFMGRRWDHGVPSEAVWSEVMRVCKPGANLMAFGGTRTHHRLMVAIEDAGWEIRDCLMWLYGCVDTDTEILVESGWKKYGEFEEGERALAFDPESETYEWQPINEVVAYEYADTAYRITGPDTDQLVSRDHRVIVERGGSWIFQRAQHVAREQEIRVPTLESVQGMRRPVSCDEPDTSNSKRDMRRRVPRHCNCSIGARSQLQNACKEGCVNLSGVRREIQKIPVADNGRDTGMFSQMQRCFARRGVERARTQGAGKLERGIRAQVEGAHDRRYEPVVEGRRHIPPAQGQLQEGQNGALPRRPSVNGEGKRLCRRAQAVSCEGSWASANFNRSRSSRGPRQPEQRPVEPCSVQKQPRPQVVRASRKTKTSVARIEPCHYEGIVWCVRVPSGAFVARRNGKIFVTGNSGFPKALNISKSIDDAEGAEREVVGQGRWAGRESSVNPMTDQSNRTDDAQDERVVTAPATDAARRFDGYKSAIKPAYEPVVLARAPLDGTYANNATEHGVAGLNVDGCRIECDGTPPTVKRRESARANDWDATSGETAKDSESRGLIRRRGDPKAYQRYRPSEELGRYPSNVILDDTAANMLDAQAGDDVSRYFYTAKASRAEREAGLSHMDADAPVFGDDGGTYQGLSNSKSKRANTHPCVKPLDLCRYFSKLLLPPPRDTDRRVLVPFSGSGSEMIGAMQAGWDYVTGIEMSPEYVEIAEARLEYWAQLGWQQDLL